MSTQTTVLSLLPIMFVTVMVVGGAGGLWQGPFASEGIGAPVLQSAKDANDVEKNASSGFDRVLCPFPIPVPERPLERCNVRATARVGPGNEIDLAMDPQDPHHMVAVAKGCNLEKVGRHLGTGGVVTPYATTFDGGLTWTEGFLQSSVPVVDGLPLGESDGYASDPVVEFAPDGSVLSMVLHVDEGRSGPDGLDVYKSDDGGRTFGPQIVVLREFVDKEWMVADPVTGNLYAVMDGQNKALVSFDGGLTWEKRGAVVGGPRKSIDVGADGTIYVVAHSGSHISFTESHDEARTWSSPRTIAAHNGMQLNPANLRLYRTPNLPQLAASRVDDTLVVAWADDTGRLQRPQTCAGTGCFDLYRHDIFVTRSLDGGATWSVPLKVNEDPVDAAFSFMPAIALSPNGKDVHVAWLDQRFDPTGVTAVVYYAHSGDKGETFDANLLVSDQPFVTTLSQHQILVGLGQGVFIGDYIGLQASNDRAVIAFPDTRYGRADIFIATVT
ncbi:MAG: exo-alpha-sialidase [Euryarchaeota archaeon]|nr:exo-alpha-sialidase [Euryarchaeota archaeon]